MSSVATRDDVGRFAGPNPGRPRKFQDIDAFQAAIDGYFAECDEQKKPYQMSGLARALECGRQTLINYENFDDAEPFRDAIKTARQRCEEYAVGLLMTPKAGVHPAGPIFILKNCHGYRDLQEVQVDARHVVMGVTVSIEQHRQELEQVDQQIRQLSSNSADVVQAGANVIEVSPQPEPVIALSPAPAIPVTAPKRKAKATPKRGVSPRNVA